MNLHPIELQDSRDLYKLLIQLGYHADPVSLQSILSRLITSDEDFLIATYEGPEMTGWLHAVNMRRLTSGTYVEIAGLVVSERARRGGAGRDLVEKAVSWAASNNIHSVRVRCNVKRDGAHKFYESLGFTIQKEQKVFDRRI